jgi:hypothetical protein
MPYYSHQSIYVYNDWTASSYSILWYSINSFVSWMVFFYSLIVNSNDFFLSVSLLCSLVRCEENSFQWVDYLSSESFNIILDSAIYSLNSVRSDEIFYIDLKST